MRESYVMANGVKTRYLESGSSSGKPLVLIHGGSFGDSYSANDWDTNIDDLGKQFHVYAFDKIGSGFTGNPRNEGDYVIGSTVEHAYDFLRAMNLDGVILAGHSRGGYTATRLTLEHPELVKELIIVDSSTLMTPPNPIYDEWKERAEKISDPKERQRYLMTVNSFSPSHITDEYTDVMSRIAGLEKSREAATRLAAGKKNFREDLVAKQKETHEWIRSGRLKCPTLVVWAYNDPSATMERCGIPCMNLILPSVPESEMHIINRAGHLCFREQPAAFNSAVIDYTLRHTR